MPEPLHRINGFRNNQISEICIIDVVNRTCEHQVLPHQQSVFIAPIVEGVIRVIAAAPYANAVVIKILGQFQQFYSASRSYPGEDIVLWNIAGAFKENPAPVNGHAKICPIRICVIVDDNFPQANTERLAQALHIICFHNNIQSVKDRITKSGRIPPLWAGNMERKETMRFQWMRLRNSEMIFRQR